jgi:hypothetical protein
MTLDVKDLQKHLKDDFVSKGEIVNGNTLKLTREQGGAVEVVLPEGQKITSFDLANRGGKNVLELKTSDGKTFTAHLPEAQQTEDKHVTAFEINTVGNDTSLTIRRNDGEKFVVHLPPQQSGGGGGTDLHITAFAYEPRINPGETVVSHMLIITRSDGKTFEVEIPIPNIGGNPGGTDIYLDALVTDAPPVERLEPGTTDGYYFTKNIPLQGVLNNGNHVTTVQPHNRLYFANQMTTDPRDAVERRPIMDIVAHPDGKGIYIVRDDATTSTVVIHGGGGSGADKFVSSLSSTIEYGDTRTEGGVSYSKATITARLNDGTSVSTKLPFEVAFDERTGEQIFPGTGGGAAGTTVVKDVAPSTSKNRTIVVTDSKGATKELTLPDNWFNGKDGKDGKDADSVKGQFITQDMFRRFHEANIIAEQLAAPIQIGAYIGNELPLPGNIQAGEAKFVVAPYLPKLASEFVINKPQGAQVHEGTVYNSPLSVRPVKGLATSWVNLIPGFDKIAPADAWSYLESKYYGDEGRTPGFLSGAASNTWHPGHAYRTIPLAKPLLSADNMFLPVPMRFHAFNYHIHGATFAMDVFELVDIADNGGLVQTDKMFYRGTMYTQTFPHGDGYFPAFISVEGIAHAEYLKLASRLSNFVIFRIREIREQEEKNFAADKLFDAYETYGVGRPNHG